MALLCVHRQDPVTVRDVTRQAVPLLSGLQEAVFLVNRQDLWLLSSSTCFNLSLNVCLCLKQRRTPLSLPPPANHVLRLPFVCGKFQSTSLIREMRNAKKKENSPRRLNHNNAVIKHHQGPSVLSQSL